MAKPVIVTSLIVPAVGNCVCEQSATETCLHSGGQWNQKEESRTIGYGSVTSHREKGLDGKQLVQVFGKFRNT